MFKKMKKYATFHLKKKKMPSPTSCLHFKKKGASFRASRKNKQGGRACTKVKNEKKRKKRRLHHWLMINELLMCAVACADGALIAAMIKKESEGRGERR